MVRGHGGPIERGTRGRRAGGKSCGRLHLDVVMVGVRKDAESKVEARGEIERRRQRDIILVQCGRRRRQRGRRKRRTRVDGGHIREILVVQLDVSVVNRVHVRERRAVKSIARVFAVWESRDRRGRGRIGENVAYDARIRTDRQTIGAELRAKCTFEERLIHPLRSVRVSGVIRLHGARNAGGNGGRSRGNKVALIADVGITERCGNAMETDIAGVE
jgi:hypothetical protein